LHIKQFLQYCGASQTAEALSQEDHVEVDVDSEEVAKVQETLGGLDRVVLWMWQDHKVRTIGFVHNITGTEPFCCEVSQVSVKPWLNSLPVVGRIWEIAED
jgi:hypothetical protein